LRRGSQTITLLFTSHSAQNNSGTIHPRVDSTPASTQQTRKPSYRW